MSTAEVHDEDNCPGSSKDDNKTDKSSLRNGRESSPERSRSRDRQSRPEQRRRSRSPQRRSRDRNSRRSSSRDRYRRKRSRSRDRYRSRHSRSRERRRRSRSRSDSRSRQRRSREYSRGHRRRSPSASRSRSLSPLSRKLRARKERISSEQSKAATKVWDGFQWVDRAPAAVASNVDAVVSAFNSSSTAVAVPGVTPLGNQKDRRIYIGNLPPDITGDMLADFVNSAMLACGGVPDGITNAVLSTWLSPENKYAFLELCSSESAAVCLGLNGISCMGCNLRIARPKTYQETPSTLF